ncbi:hypothetical protein BBP40_010240 [Aspergillus hancockii]|nr:hypothetical protein BBP40_010240 [Aspergillus hancockii]
MQPWLVSRNCLFLSFVLHILACQAAWVRKFQCGTSRPRTLQEDLFRIDSFRGTFDTFDGSTELSLSILAVHNVSQFSCSDLDLTEFESHLRFHVLGYPVGHLQHLRSRCPLPIIDALTPPEGTLFSKYELVYSFGQTHRLQTLATEISFKVRNGTEIDCGWAKITPDIGTAASAAFNYVPAVVMILVSIASWLKHFSDLSGNSLFEYKSAWTSQGPVWEVILDIADYLRYLQFIFLAASLTMEYPGFYQPIVSQVAWSSLLYWAGPIDHGFTWTGIEEGMYVSNASYGLEYMAQMLGFPQMPDIMFDAFINLFILVSALIVVMLIIFLVTSGSGQVPPLGSLIKKAGYIILGVTLSFFTLPLLSYMTYELILIGYLPNYRIILVVLMMVVVGYLNYAIVRYFEAQKELRDTSSVEVASQDDPATGRFRLVYTFAYYVPHVLPLLQGIVIGGLQDWSWVQLLVLGGCEVVTLLSTIIQQHTRLFMSKTLWCAAVRFLTILLSIAFARPSTSETARQWIGYLILCLHGAVVIFGYLFVALWKLSRAVWKKNGSKSNPSSNRESHSNSVPPLTLANISPHLHNNNVASQTKNSLNNRYKPSFVSFPSSSRPGSSGTSFSDIEDANDIVTPFAPTPTGVRHYVTDFSSFYRAPRPQKKLRHAETSFTSQESSSINSSGGPSVKSSSESNQVRRSQDTLDELLETPSRPYVDYSVRESDSYYGRPTSDSTSPMPISWESMDDGQSSRQILNEWTRRTVARLKPKEKEKGFQVMRPPRQT